MVISAAGISGQKQNASKNIKDVSVIPGEQQVYAATSSNSAAKIAKENGFVLLKSGWVSGIPEILLNEGFIAGMDVIVLLVNTLKNVPDFRASALISGAVTRLVPDLYCDIGSLMSEAQIIENKMKQIRNGRNGSMSMYK
jgi:predicted ATP-grasp superfamily ATP-dependent carboligase